MRLSVTGKTVHLWMALPFPLRIVDDFGGTE